MLKLLTLKTASIFFIFIFVSCASYMTDHKYKLQETKQDKTFGNNLDTLKKEINNINKDLKTIDLMKLKQDIISNFIDSLSNRVDKLENYTPNRKPIQYDEFKNKFKEASSYSKQLSTQYKYFISNADNILQDKNLNSKEKIKKLRKVSRNAFDVNSYNFDINKFPSFLGELMSIDSYDKNILSIGLGLGLGIINFSGPQMDLLYAHKTKHFFRGLEIGEFFTIETGKLYFLGMLIDDNLPLTISAYRNGRQSINSFDPIVSFESLKNYYNNTIGPEAFEVHIVEKNENIWKISKSYYTTQSLDIYMKISEINGIYPPKNNMIFPGQKLIIPKTVQFLEKMYNTK